MARIRTIKPGFWSDEDLSKLPEATHMLAAALLNYADDDGYFNANPSLVKAACCPLREPSVSIHDSLTHLSNSGWIKLGIGSDGKQYGFIVTFSVHQRINRKTESKIKNIEITWQDSLSPHGVLTEPSHPEGKGREEERNAACAHSGVPSGSVLKIGDRLDIEKPVTGPPATPEAQYFDRGKEILGQSAGGLLAKLLKAKAGNVALARSVVELASTKQNPREYIGAIIRGTADPPDVQRVYRW